MRSMRWALLVVPLLSFVPSGAAEQLPTQGTRQDAQRRIEDFAQTEAERLARTARTRRSGTLNLAADEAFRHLGETIRVWKGEKNSGADAVLAEGVLFDCLSRLEGVQMRPLLYERGGPYLELAAERKAKAIRSFNSALRLQPSATEARFRLARLTGALPELESLANDDSLRPFNYLAAASRGSLAHSIQDQSTALHWYGRARALNPDSSAAAIAIGLLDSSEAEGLSWSPVEDLYYAYPCIVLTDDVGRELFHRLRRQLAH